MVFTNIVKTFRKKHNLQKNETVGFFLEKLFSWDNLSKSPPPLPYGFIFPTPITTTDVKFLPTWAHAQDIPGRGDVEVLIWLVQTPIPNCGSKVTVVSWELTVMIWYTWICFDFMAILVQHSSVLFHLSKKFSLYYITKFPINYPACPRGDVDFTAPVLCY